jgi:hypothetical protein
MIALYVFLALIFVFCAVSSMPTAGWMALGRWLQASRTRSARRVLERELARLARRTAFHAESGYLARGAGLAFDRRRGLVYVATREGRTARGAILPAERLLWQTAGTARHYGFEDHYVDVTFLGAMPATWRIWCGEDAVLAREIEAALEAARRGAGGSAA